MNMCIYVCYVYTHNVIYVKVEMYERKVDILKSQIRISHKT